MTLTYVVEISHILVAQACPPLEGALPCVFSPYLT